MIEKEKKGILVVDNFEIIVEMCDHRTQTMLCCDSAQWSSVIKSAGDVTTNNDRFGWITFMVLTIRVATSS